MAALICSGVSALIFVLEIRVPLQRAVEKQKVVQAAGQLVVLRAADLARLQVSGLGRGNFLGGEAVLQHALDFFLERRLELLDVLRRVDGGRGEAAVLDRASCTFSPSRRRS